MDPRSTSLDLEEALRHTDWLRRLALRLVDDPQSADDLVQETWIRAWRSAPSDGTNRAWLGTVLRRLARGRGRGEGRRTTREALGARDEALPAAADLVQRAELQKRLTEAVLALPEAEREAILLHYFEGFSSAEIARRQGLPASTVRDRVRRGLAALRETLDRDYGTRAVWSGLVLLHFGGAEAAASAGVAASAGATAWKIGSLGWITAAVLACAVTLATWLPERATLPPLVEPLAGGNTTADVTTGRAEAAGLPPTAVALDARDEPGRRQASPVPGEVHPSSAEPEPVSPHPPAVLHATLLDPRGAPVRRGWLALEDESERAHTRGDGSAALHVPCDAAEPRTALLLAGGDGVATRGIPVRFAAGEELVLGEFVLERAVAVRGMVTDRLGDAVSGATVKAFGSEVGIVGILDDDRRWVGPSHDLPVPTTTTDETGHFVLEGVPVGRQRLWAGGAGCLWGPGERLDLEVGRELAPQRLIVDPITERDWIGGVVRGPDGAPIAGARVSARMPLANGGAGSILEADEHGAFRFPLRQRIPHDVTAYDPEGRWAHCFVPRVEPGTADLELALVETHRMRVSVRHDDGTLVRSFGVQLSAAENEAPDLQWTEAEADREGFVSVAQLPVPFFLGVRAAGRQPMRYGPFEPGEATDRIEIVLSALPTVSGEVRDEDGPVAGAEVRLCALLAPNRRVMIDGQRSLIHPEPVSVAHTDEAGRFELEFGGPGHYMLRATSADRVPAERWPMVLGASSVRGVVLRHGEGGSLVVRYARDGERSPAGRVVVLNHGVGEVISRRFDESGELTFDGLTPGKWKVSLAELEPGLADAPPRAYVAAGPSPMNWTCEVFAGERTRVVLRDRDPVRSTVRGHVTIDGKPAAGWTVRGRHSGVPLDAPWIDAVVDADGAFELSFGDEGRVSVCTSAPETWGNLVACEELELGGDSATEWRVDLASGALVASGLPRLTDGAGLQLRQVMPVDGRAVYLVSSVVPGEDGELFLPRLPVGLWTVVHYDPLAPRSETESGWRSIGEFVVEAGRETRFGH